MTAMEKAVKYKTDKEIPAIDVWLSFKQVGMVA